MAAAAAIHLPLTFLELKLQPLQPLMPVQPLCNLVSSPPWPMCPLVSSPPWPMGPLVTKFLRPRLLATTLAQRSTVAPRQSSAAAQRPGTTPGPWQQYDAPLL